MNMSCGCKYVHLNPSSFKVFKVSPNGKYLKYAPLLKEFFPVKLLRTIGNSTNSTFHLNGISGIPGNPNLGIFAGMVLELYSNPSSLSTFVTQKVRGTREKQGALNPITFFQLCLQ